MLVTIPHWIWRIFEYLKLTHTHVLLERRTRIRLSSTRVGNKGRKTPIFSSKKGNFRNGNKPGFCFGNEEGVKCRSMNQTYSVGDFLKSNRQFCSCLHSEKQPMANQKKTHSDHRLFHSLQHHSSRKIFEWRDELKNCPWDQNCWSSSNEEFISSHETGIATHWIFVIVELGYLFCFLNINLFALFVQLHFLYSQMNRDIESFGWHGALYKTTLISA